MKIMKLLQISSILLNKSTKLSDNFQIAKKQGIFQMLSLVDKHALSSKLSQFGNHPDSRNLWKVKPSALNRQSKGLCTHQFL